MLTIENLHATIQGKPILKGINLTVNQGEIHAIMGPNGSGKSTLAAVITGKEDYEITQGSITFKGKNLTDMTPEERAAEGVFLAFQYPVSIPGVSNMNFLKTAVNQIRKYHNQKPLSAHVFLKLIKDKIKIVDMDKALVSRALNEGFSGGEKKRNEVFQMAVLDPILNILDETDSGLDIDSLRIVANGINTLARKDNAFIIITHYDRLLQYISPDVVHVLYKGKIIKSGNRSLALQLEQKGYEWLSTS